MSVNKTFSPIALIDFKHLLTPLLLLLGFSMSARSCKVCDETFQCEIGKYILKEDLMEECCHLTCKDCDGCGLGTNLHNPYIKLECSKYNNTVCCHRPEEVVVNGECQMPPPSTPSPTTVKETTTTVVATGVRLAVTGNFYNSTAKNISSATVERLIVLSMIVYLVLK